MEPDLIQEYFELKDEMFDYFEYKENFTIFPLENGTEYYWYLTDDDVWFSEFDSHDDDDDGSDLYRYAIYKQLILKKWVYRTGKYTMVLVQTDCDNRFLLILSNERERKELTSFDYEKNDEVNYESK